LSRLSGLDQGVGRAIVELTERVDVMNAALAEARGANEVAARDLRVVLREAEIAERRLKTAIAEAARSKREAETDPGEDVERATEVQDEQWRAPKMTYPPADEPVAYDEAERPATDPLRETMNVIDRAPPGEEDEVFANRLVDALSSLSPKPDARS
ncbi:MAG: hypothetical protein AAFU55_13500, partial [Pseudomonadota bacterium]